MHEQPNRPAILFYVARCHSDLSWFLAVETRQSANETRARDPGPGIAGKPGNVFTLVKTPAECECAITE
jgi:hypothetical protein